MNTPTQGGNPLFFRLDIESLSILSRLRYSEFKTYGYLRANDWFCNKQQNLNIADLLKVCNLSKTAAYLALANLHAKGLIEWVHIRSNVRVRPLSSGESFSHRWESSPTHGNEFPPMGTDSHPWENRHLKVAASGDSEAVRSLDHLDQLEEIKKDDDFSTDSEYLQWIERGLNALPHPPEGHYRDRMLQKAIQDPKNQKLYKSKKKVKKPTISPLEPIPSFPTNGEFQQQQQQQRLETLQHLWSSGDKSRVKATIGANPQWGIVIGPYGPESPVGPGNE